MSNDQSTGSAVQQQGLLQLRSTTPRESETNFGLGSTPVEKSRALGTLKSPAARRAVLFLRRRDPTQRGVCSAGPSSRRPALGASHEANDRSRPTGAEIRIEIQVAVQARGWIRVPL